MRKLAIVAASGLMLTTAACGGDSLENSSGDTTAPDSTDTTSSGATAGGPLVLGGQNFTEMQVMASMYDQLLTAAGYDVTVKLVTTRDVYVNQLGNGGVDVVPDYLAGLTDFLNTEKNGPDAAPVSSNDAQETFKALVPLAEAKGISILVPSEATDQNAFFVTKTFADDNDLTTLSDLAALNQPITLAAPSDCKGRSDCEGGLTNVYGMDIKQIIPLDFASQQAKDSVESGESTMGETGTTDGTLAAGGFVLLHDDKGIQPAQNLTPAVNTDFLNAHPDIAQILNPLSAALTTNDLATMIAKVDVARQKPDDVANEFLTNAGLL